METWKDIIGYEGLYQISNMGRVRITASKKLRRLNTCDRYVIILLTKDNAKKAFKVHRLVAIHFIPNPHDKPEVNHKKGNKHDNRHFMIEWSTRSENMIHSYKTGIHRPSGCALTGNPKHKKAA